MLNFNDSQNISDVLELTEQAQQDVTNVIKEINSNPDLIELLALINKHLKVKNRKPEYQEADNYLCEQLNSCAITTKHGLQAQTWNKILKLREPFKTLQDIYIAVKNKPDTLINKYNAFYKLITKNNGINKNLLVIEEEYIKNKERMPIGLLELYNQLNLFNHKTIYHRARKILNEQIKEDVKSVQNLFQEYQALYVNLTLKDAILTAQKEALETLIKDNAIDDDISAISDSEAIKRANNLNTLLLSSENISLIKAQLALESKMQAIKESEQTLAAFNDIPILAIRLHTMLQAISPEDRASISAHSYDDIYQYFCEELNEEIEETKFALQDEVYAHIKELRLKYNNLNSIYQAIISKNANLQSEYNKFNNLIVRENGIQQNLLEVTADIIKNPALKTQDLLILAGELRILLDAEDSLCSIIGDKRDIYNICSVVRLHTNLRAELNFQIWQDLQKLQEQYTNYLQIYDTDYILPPAAHAQKQDLDNLILQYTSDVNLAKANEEIIHNLADEAAVVLVADLVDLSGDLESATIELKAQLEAAKLREEFGDKFADLQALYADLKEIFNALKQPTVSLQDKYTTLANWLPAHREIEQDLTLSSNKLNELVQELDILLNDSVYVEARTLLNNQIVADIQKVATEYNTYIELYNKLPNPEDSLTADKLKLDTLINNATVPLNYPAEINIISALSVTQATALITVLNKLIIPSTESIAAAQEKLEINIKEREDARASLIADLKKTTANRLSNEKIQQLEVYLNQLIGLGISLEKTSSGPELNYEMEVARLEEARIAAEIVAAEYAAKEAVALESARIAVEREAIAHAARETATLEEARLLSVIEAFRIEEARITAEIEAARLEETRIATGVKVAKLEENRIVAVREAAELAIREAALKETSLAAELEAARLEEIRIAGEREAAERAAREEKARKDATITALACGNSVVIEYIKYKNINVEQIDDIKGKREEIMEDMFYNDSTNFSKVAPLEEPGSEMHWVIVKVQSKAGAF